MSIAVPRLLLPAFLLPLLSIGLAKGQVESAVLGGAPQRSLLEYMQLVQMAETSTNATANPLLASPWYPLYDKITPGNLVTSLASLFAELDSSMDHLEGSHYASWQDTVDPFEEINDRMNVAWAVVDHLQSVKNSDALRAVVDQLQPEQVRISQRLSQSSPLYSKFQAIRKSTGNWSESETRVLDNLITTAKLAGAALEAAVPEGKSKDEARVEATNRFNDINMQLSTLATNFSNNLLDSTAAFKKLITEKAGVSGFPSSFLGQAAQQAAEAGHAGATAEGGPWLIGLDAPSYTAVMTYADNRTLRQEVYTAYETRASSGSTNNSPIVEQIMSLRQEQARLAGYSNAAEYLMSNKMATPKTAMALLEELRNASFATAQNELTALQDFAATQGFAEALMNWDQSYYAQKQQAALFNLTDEDVRPYFAYPTVLAGLHELIARLFNATIVADDGAVPVWDPSVRFFRVYRNGQPKGHLYIDPYARPGEKQQGAWEATMVSQSALLAAPGQKLRLPVAVIVTNQSPPVGNAPSLMTMEDVVTIFHEHGHAMQALLTTQTDVTVSGINGIEQDAIEQPSQFLERWPYEREVTFSIGKHYKTNETLPEELYQKIAAARNYRSGTDVLRQLYFAILDLTLHEQYFPKPEQSFEDTQLFNDVVNKTTVLPPIPGDRFLNGFTHIFSGGYAAGYYGYKWAQVMSIDGFAAFEEIGMSNAPAIDKEGLRYRDTILSMGGARAPELVFEDFRGRPPITTPLLKDEGLIPNSTAAAPAPVTKTYPDA